MAPPQPRPPRLKPLRVRLAHGGEVDFHGDAAKLRRVHPGATIVSFSDGSRYVASEQDTQPDVDAIAEAAAVKVGQALTTEFQRGKASDGAKTDEATGKGGGTKTQTKAAGDSKDAG